jgi:hypothetical protein
MKRFNQRTEKTNTCPEGAARICIGRVVKREFQGPQLLTVLGSPPGLDQTLKRWLSKPGYLRDYAQ